MTVLPRIAMPGPFDLAHDMGWLSVTLIGVAAFELAC